MTQARVGRRLLAILHPVIPQDGRDAEAVAGEDAAAPASTQETASTETQETASAAQDAPAAPLPADEKKPVVTEEPVAVEEPVVEETPEENPDTILQNYAANQR
mgnify:CR=1 FL=1